jgi:apolipoprotein N-acyltransferase
VPLATLGISQAGGPLLGVARIGGVVLLTWIVFQVGFALAGFVDRSPLGARRIGIAACVVAVAVAAVAPSGNDTGESMTVAAVQGGGEQGTTALDVPSRVVTERLLAATDTISPDPDLDLVVWPENGVDVNDQPLTDSAAYRAIAAQAVRLGVPFAVGVTIDSEFSAYPTEGRS